jgi:hypothetical protein
MLENNNVSILGKHPEDARATSLGHRPFQKPGHVLQAFSVNAGIGKHPEEANNVHIASQGSIQALLYR